MTDLAQKEVFWNAVWHGGDASSAPREHPLRAMMEAIVRDHGLQGARMLEVGCGAGGLQELSPRYVGTDISPACAPYVRAPATFVCTPAHALPFEDRSFDFVFSIYVLEHLAEIEPVLQEIRRVTRPGGLVLLKPAWFCRPWTGREWFHKDYAECSMRERILKHCVRVRNSVPYRAIDLLSWRLRRPASGGKLRYRRIQPNFAMPEVIDADAEAWLDPLDVISWFRRQGDRCLSHVSFRDRWCRTSDAVMFRIR